MKITKSEYKALSELYNNYNDAFHALPREFKQGFYDVLYSKIPYDFKKAG
jgi:hypothetical protein